MHGVEQPPQYHPEGDVWVHTMLLLEKLPAGCSPTLAWGALLHDIGKPATFQPPNPARPGDRIRFNGHVEVGVRIAEEILAPPPFLQRRRRPDRRARQATTCASATSARCASPPSSASSACRTSRSTSRCTGSTLPPRTTSSTCTTSLARPTSASPRRTCAHAPLLTGRDLIAAGYRPSPRFKAMLALAEDAQLERRISTPEEALALVRQEFPAEPQRTVKATA